MDSKPHPMALTGEMLIPLAERLQEALETITALIHCRVCGTGKDVQIIPMAPQGTVTPICPACLKAVKERDRKYWEEFESQRLANKSAEKRPGLLARMLALFKAFCRG